MEQPQCQAECDTTVAATGNNTGIVVPDEIIEQLGAGRRAAVVVNVNGYQYRSTAGVMGGKHMIRIRRAGIDFCALLHTHPHGLTGR